MEMREKRNNLFKEIKKELATQEEISAKKIRTTNNTSKQTIQSDEMKASSETTHEKLHQYKGRKFLFPAVILIVGLIAGIFAYDYYLSSIKKSPEAKLFESLSKIIILPEEEANIFDIQDPELLSKEQDFFMGSKLGDKLFVFPISGKAVIYRPEDNIIVNVGPVFFDNSEAQ